jgi:hypothetical protein
LTFARARSTLRLWFLASLLSILSAYIKCMLYR